MKFSADRESWTKYIEVVGDSNLIHTDDRIAIDSGLEGIVAPGMWLASHVPLDGSLRKIGKVKFLRSVYDGEDVSVDKMIYSESGGQDYELNIGGRIVCKLEDVQVGGPSGTLVLSPESFDYVRQFDITPKNVEDFRSSLNTSSNNSNFDLLIASLSASTLTSYGAEESLRGIHGSQSIEIVDPYHLGKINVGLKEVKKSNRMNKFRVYWMQDEKVFAIGESCVLPIRE